jgi:quinol monooxygenase YgiN
MKLREMDERTTYLEQLQEDGGQVVLINQFEVPPQDAERFLEVWADDAAFMTRQPGFISTQLHRGTAGSSTFMNVAVWESAAALGQAFRSSRALVPNSCSRGSCSGGSGSTEKPGRGSTGPEFSGAPIASDGALNVSPGR